MKNAMTLSITVVLLALLIPVLSGCYTPAGRSAGEVVDDTTIGTKIKAKLFDKNELSGFAINVNVFDGEVHLTGAVGSEYHKQLASDVAASVRGVKNVNNNLNIKQKQ